MFEGCISLETITIPAFIWDTLLENTEKRYIRGFIQKVSHWKSIYNGFENDAINSFMMK